nr:efflux RND transporter permease subunit [Kibdelosporangium sp. MJ126-NF4]CEL21705.1 Cobalt-zinc-cadmium resistance protein CzcA; Cation efflux system protein CusA [Kibdelosporangium sp. MJ126-NF4]CTQ92486.1 Cobalt-zinc-cadmium resistance protein CzcA; Cation efflux system protein CusA [Kibdelosporangium sp. MJ126-NF4]
MLRWFVGSSIRLRLLVLPIAIAAMFFGVFQLQSTQVEVLPEFTPPRVEIQTEALGLSAGEVEQLITAPLEADLLNQVAWIDEIRSESVPGLSSIEMIFEPGTDILDARQMVQERLAQAGDMPNVSKPPVIMQPLSSTSRLMMVGLSAKDVSLIEMSVLARWKVKPRLLGVPGVANVAIFGQRERQLQVHLDPERMRQHGVPVSQVIRTTGNALWVSPLSFLEASTPGSGGFVESPQQRMGVQHVLPITTPQALSQVTLEDTSGKRLRISDVADVVENHQPLIGDALINDEPSLMMVVESFPGFSTVDVTKGVEDALRALRPGLSGITVDTTVYRPATFIEQATDNLTLALLIGLVLLIVLFGLMFFDWRVALVSLVAVPLSLLGAGLVLHFMGAGFNLVALAGFAVAIAVVVDDAIVDIDNIRRRLRQRRQEGSEFSATVEIVKASVATRVPLVYATVILLLAVVPFLFFGGMTGAFFSSFGLAYAVALLVSMVVAVLVTPALAVVLLGRAELRRGDPPVVRWLQRVHGALLSRFVAGKRSVYVAVGVALVAGIVGLPTLLGTGAALPPLQDRTLVVNWEAVPGTSQPEMNRVTELAGRELRAIPGVRNVAAHTGRAVTSDQVVNINSGQLWVSLDPDAPYDNTVNAVRDAVGGYAGLSSQVLTYPEARMSDVRTDADNSLVVRLYGQSPDVLRSKAEELQRAIAEIDGVGQPRLDLPAQEPTVEVEVNLEAAHAHGIKPGDVRRAAAIFLSGVEVGSLFEEQKVFDVVVWGSPQTRHSLTNVKEVLVDTPNGARVPLGELADVRVRPYPVVIKRDSVQRRVDITADVQGRDLGSVVRDVQSRIQQVDFPVEHHAEILGKYAQKQGERQQALIFAIAALVGILLLLQAAFASWRLAFVLLLTLPVALAGGALAAMFAGAATTLGTLVGFLAVLAIAVRHGIMLFTHFQRLHEDEGGRFGTESVLRGTRERLTPIVTSSLAVALVVLPFAVMGGISGHEVVFPLAIVILGGLLTSTLVTLFVLPALYLRFAPKGESNVEQA